MANNMYICGDEATVEANDDDATNRTRRGYLKGVLGVGVAGAGVRLGTGVGAASSSDTTDLFAEYDRVYDVVEAGADNTGGQPINDVLERLRGDNTLLVFPPGRYLMDRQFRFSGFEQFGLVGNDATLVPASYHDFEGPQYRLFRLGVHYAPGTDIRFEGFEVDFTADDTGIRVIDALASKRLQVRDVDVIGHHDSGTWGPGRFCVTDEDGVGIVERFRAPDGGAWVDETPNDGNLWKGPSGIVANVHNHGELTFRDCELGGFPDNGLYASGGTGKIVVDGGLYKNSDTANIRLGGEGSEIRNATVIVDDNRPQDVNQRAIRLENGTDLSVRDTDIRIPSVNGHALTVMNTCESTWIQDVRISMAGDRVKHGIVVSPEAGETTIYRTAIDMNTPGGYGIKLADSTRTARVNCENVKITGDVGDEGARSAIFCARDNVRLSMVTVDQTGAPHRRAVENVADDCKIYGGEYVASERPICNYGDGLRVEGTYAESADGYYALYLYDPSRDAYIKQSTLANGIYDKSEDELRAWGNEF
ncbi:right-handed parallel beta-helix repeat-containing protein [Haloprofundus halophilus]|uniref:right-handed parallel beta-helix repeat-containing protein n=1 Tax=Haloprofundus halophilus TaxID=2283527 RepID=UPI0018E5293A|nr:right-handed parallel beta-helix repeat-containing protein [Haloprofundus halophilus]